MLKHFYYLHTGTGLDWQSCPAGTYGAKEGLVSLLECTSCDAGKYCEGTHLTAVSGNCSAGHYCTSGVDRPNPGIGNDSLSDPTCPEQTYFTGR